MDLWTSLAHVGSLVTACKLSVAACGIKFPDQGSNPGSLFWEHGDLATGPPGKSLEEDFEVHQSPESVFVIHHQVRTTAALIGKSALEMPATPCNPVSLVCSGFSGHTCSFCACCTWGGGGGERRRILISWDVLTPKMTGFHAFQHHTLPVLWRHREELFSSKFYSVVAENLSCGIRQISSVNHETGNNNTLYQPGLGRKVAWDASASGTQYSLWHIYWGVTGSISWLLVIEFIKPCALVLFFT